MSRRRHDRWLLIRLAAQNVGRRRLRAIFLGLAVMLGVGIGFASFVAGWALRDGMARSFSRMGADLLVVPRATLVNITASLLTVQPTDETWSADLAQRIAAISGVAQVAPQRVVPQGKKRGGDENEAQSDLHNYQDIAESQTAVTQGRGGPA